MLEWGSYLICVDSIVLVAHISFISWMMLSWTASDCSTLSCKTQARCFSMTSHLKDGEQQAKVGVQLELCPSRKPQWRQKCDSKASPRSCALYSFVFQRGSCTCSSPVSAADPVLMEGAWQHCMGPPFRWAWGAGERGQGQPDSKPHSD